MALFKILKGNESNLPATLTEGYCYFCTNTGNFYIDYKDETNALTRSKLSSKYADKLRYTQDGQTIEIDPIDIATKAYVDERTKQEFDTIVTDQASWDNMLVSTTARNILVFPSENTDTITLESTVTLPSTAQYIRFSAPYSNFFTLPEGGCTLQANKSTQNLVIQNLVQRTKMVINNIAYVVQCQVGTIQNAIQAQNCVCKDKYYNIRSAIQCVTSSLTHGTFESVQTCTTCYGYDFIGCNNLVGCRGTVFDSCDTIILNSKITNSTFTNCTNLIQETNVSNGIGDSSIQAGYESTTAKGDYSIAIGNEKDGVPTESIGKSSMAIGSGVKTYGKYSLGIGSLICTGVPDEIKQQSVANYLNNGVDGIIKVPAGGTYCYLKLRNPNYTGGLPAFTPTGENNTYQASDIDLSLMTGDYENYFIKFGNNALVTGYSSNAVGQSSIIAGNYNATFGHSSAAIGYLNNSYSAGSVSLGVQNEAGYWTDQYAGHVEFTDGTAAVALGRKNKAYGTASVAIGDDNKATDEGSVTIGTGLSNHTAKKITVGKYNEDNADNIFEVGIGTSDSNRQNALSIKSNYSLFENNPVVSDYGYKTNASYQIHTESASAEIKIPDDATMYVNSNRLIIDFPENTYPVLNRGDIVYFSFVIDSTAYSCTAKAVEFWSIKYRKTEGKNTLPSIGFSCDDYRENTNLLKLAGKNKNNTPTLNLVVTVNTNHSNILDRYGIDTANYQTLVGNMGTGDSTTLFAVGNGLMYSESGSGTRYNERNNALEVKTNGDVVIDGTAITKAISVGNSFTITSTTTTNGITNTVITSALTSGDTLDFNGYQINLNPSYLYIGSTSNLVKVTNLDEPRSDADAATKKYVDSAIASAITAALSTAV